MSLILVIFSLAVTGQEVLPPDTIRIKGISVPLDSIMKGERKISEDAVDLPIVY
ncbi:MAG: hypothetical protein IH593_10915, partial [Bacteroidales bacterium]|nr:hypothetical protein [Bacteroidales bacterium]